MKQLTIPKTKRISLCKIPRKNRTQKTKKAEKNCGRWSLEEHKLFEKNYIAYLQKKITLQILIKSIPTRTPAQTHSHLNKKKYELDRKFCAIGDKNVRAEIFSINEFFEKEKFQKNPKPTQLVYLRDEMKKKNYAISLENFVLLKKFFPNRNELKLDFQAVHNFLLAVKAEREYAEMLKRHDAELKRESSHIGTKLKTTTEPSSTLNSSLSSFSYASSPLLPSLKPVNPSVAFTPESFLKNTKKENFECKSTFKNNSSYINFKINKLSEMRTADCTPIEAKIPAAAAAAFDKTGTESPNFISEFGHDCKEEMSAEAYDNYNYNNNINFKKSNFITIKNKKYLNFTSDETSETSNNYIKYNYNNKNNENNNNCFAKISKSTFDNGTHSSISENPRLFRKIKSLSELKKNPKDSNLFFCKKASNSPLNKSPNANNSKNNFACEFSSLESCCENNKASASDLETLSNSSSYFSQQNTENAYLNNDANFFFNQAGGKASLMQNNNNNNNTNIFINAKNNFSFGKTFEQPDFTNKDSSVLFNNLIFSLCSNANFNSNNEFFNAGFTSDFNSETQNALFSNANLFNGFNNTSNLNSTENANKNLNNPLFSLNGNNTCFSSLYPFEAEFCKDNNGFKFEQQFNFLY